MRLLGLTLTINLMWLATLAAYVVVWVLLAVSVDDALPLVLFGLISVPLFVVGMAFFWIRVYYLPAPVLMLEDVGIFGAIGRGFRLTRRQFWRTFGIALLTILIASIAGYMLAFPVSLIGQVFTIATPEYATLLLVGHPGGVDRDLVGVRRAVQRCGGLAAVPRPAHAQGGLRRRADDASRDHGPVIPHRR